MSFKLLKGWSCIAPYFGWSQCYEGQTGWPQIACVKETQPAVFPLRTSHCIPTTSREGARDRQRNLKLLLFLVYAFHYLLSVTFIYYIIFLFSDSKLYLVKSYHFFISFFTQTWNFKFLEMTVSLFQMKRHVMNYCNLKISSYMVKKTSCIPINTWWKYKNECDDCNSQAVMHNNWCHYVSVVVTLSSELRCQNLNSVHFRVGFNCSSKLECLKVMTHLWSPIC